MKIEYTLPGGGRGMRPREFGMVAEAEPCGRPPRLARLLALAHKLDGLVRSGAVKGYAELARLGHVTPARLTQIMILLHLAPSIQEYILFQPTEGLEFITELELRQIAREPLWDRQREIFERLLKK
jgi:hypothetical protein